MRKVALGLAFIFVAAAAFLALGPGLRKAQGDSGDAMATKAKRDLACRLGISEGRIRVVSVEEVTWPDASLGCPEPDKLYAQMLVPGYKIILRAKGKDYEYHTDKNRVVTLCPQKLTMAEAAPGLKVAYLKEPARPNPNLNLELWVSDLEKGQESLLVSDVDEFHFSPDRQNLALLKRTSRSAVELSFAKGDGTNRKPYWTCVAPSGFVWAPDSDHFAFLSREALDRYQLGVVVGSLSGDKPSGPVYLPPEEKMVRGELTWDSASSTVILSAFSDGAMSDVWAIPLEMRQPKLLLRGCGGVEAL
jgi:hypothetical protein